MHLSHMQKNQPWAIPYSARLAACPAEETLRLANHTILHAAKSVGKLAAVIESTDHTDDVDLSPEQKVAVMAMSADLVTSALRLANLFGFDLEAIHRNRVAEKNGAPYPPGATTMNEHLITEFLKPLPTYSLVGDMLVIYLENEPAYGDPVNQQVTVERAFSDKRVVGLKIFGVAAMVAKAEAEEAMREEQVRRT